MNKRENRELIQDALNTALSGLQDDPWLAQRVIAKEKEGLKIKKKFSVGLILCFALLTLSVVALASILLKEHQVEMLENVTIKDLLPEQWQQYDVCHKVSSGYLIGGFELGDDYIAPMEEEDKILYLNSNFDLVWILDGDDLNGCLFDKVEETKDAFYFGMERQKEKWIAALMKVSMQGDIVWIWEGEDGFRIKDFLITSEDVIYCAGRSGMNDENMAILLKIDDDGSLEWKRDFKEYGLTTLSAISEWQDGLLGVGQCREGIAFLKMDESGIVSAYAVYDIDRQIDTIRLQRISDGRTALVFTISATSSHKDVTQETKYMIVPSDIFG